MKNPSLSPADLETLSAYLDGELSPKERLRLEVRLREGPDLRSALEGLQKTRAVLRSAPKMRAPRNFTLTPQMAGARALPRETLAARLYPALRLSSALASVLLLLVVAGELFLSAPRLATRQIAQQPALEEAPAAKEMPAPAEAIEPVVAATEEEVFGEAADMAMATPLPTVAAKMPPEGVGGGPPYPPPGEAPLEAPAVSALTFPAPLTPTAQAIAPYPLETSMAEALPAAEAEQALATSAPGAEFALQATPQSALAEPATRSGGWPFWRWVELFLAALALSSGLAALLLRPRRL